MVSIFFFLRSRRFTCVRLPFVSALVHARSASNNQQITIDFRPESRSSKGPASASSVVKRRSAHVMFTLQHQHCDVNMCSCSLGASLLRNSGRLRSLGAFAGCVLVRVLARVLVLLAQVCCICLRATLWVQCLFAPESCHPLRLVQISCFGIS